MKILKSKQFLLFSVFAIFFASYTANCYGAANNTKEFFKEENVRDGSMFPGGSCAACTKDGSMIPGGRCERCKTPCKDCQDKPKTQPRKSYIQNYTFIEEDEIYRGIHYRCGDFAPVQLEWVDFRIQKGRKFSPYSNNLGNYRFRIFGCRRETKNAILNQGRIMQKDMQFIRIFDDAVGDCYPIVKVPNDVCLEDNNEPTPEYILTAEITDYYMNLCDGYNWDETKPDNARTGSAEMTVTWRLMDLSKTNVLWKGDSVGYSEVNEGEYNGELILIERAFADAVDNLRTVPGFERQLATRIPAKELQAQKESLIAMERVANPVKCQYMQEIQQAQRTKPICQQPQTTCSVCPQCPSCVQQAPIKTLPICPTVVAQVQPQPLKLCADGSAVDAATGLCSTTAQVVVKDTGDEPLEVDLTAGLIEEKGGSSSAGGDGSDKGAIMAENTVVEGANTTDAANNVTILDESWIDVPADNSASKEAVDNRKMVEEGFANSKNSLCIVNRGPYDNLSPENLYTVRASIMSITNANGKKGAGLIISDQFVLTSADLITKGTNKYDLATINGNKYTASAFRVNPNKNVALLLLDEKTLYTPLSLNLDLPEINKDTFMTLGLLDFDSGEGYLDNNGKVSGYRYSDEKGAEIIVDTFVQTVTLGGALIDSHGTVNGLAHGGKKLEDGPDLFIPIETALKSVGLEVCGQLFGPQKEIPELTRPVSNAIENNVGDKEPEIMNKKERK